jgi:hypothetical protein
MRGNEKHCPSHDDPRVCGGQIARSHGAYSGSRKTEPFGFMASPYADISMDEQKIAGYFCADVVQLEAGKAAFRALAEDVFIVFQLVRFFASWYLF